MWSTLRGLGSVEEAEGIDWQVRRVRKVHRRHRHARTFSARGCRRSSWPLPARVVPKGMFSVSLIALPLVEKFVLGRPPQRIVLLLGMQGLRVSPDTLRGMLGRVLLRYGPSTRRSWPPTGWSPACTRMRRAGRCSTSLAGVSGFGHSSGGSRRFS